jgi:hypothetical protein
MAYTMFYQNCHSSHKIHAKVNLGTQGKWRLKKPEIKMARQNLFQVYHTEFDRNRACSLGTYMRTVKQIDAFRFFRKRI